MILFQMLRVAIFLLKHEIDLLSLMFSGKEFQMEAPSYIKLFFILFVLGTDLIVDWIELPYLSKMKPIFMRAFYFRGPKGVNSIWRK